MLFYFYFVVFTNSILPLSSLFEVARFFICMVRKLTLVWISDFQHIYEFIQNIINEVFVRIFCILVLPRGDKRENNNRGIAAEALPGKIISTPTVPTTLFLKQRHMCFTSRAILFSPPTSLLFA
jgi:hypothetical protein